MRAKVNVVGVSSLAAGHKTLVPQLIEALKAQRRRATSSSSRRRHPRQDYEFLLDDGVAAVFGPGTNVLEAARAVLDLIEGKRRNVGSAATR